ncbi:MAG: hypothetical protein ACFFAO_03810 [Candidatus Hermodarchaeota archaeon]
MDLDKQIGQKVNLKGTAKDAKGGAVLLTPEGNVIYIKGLESWPSNILDKSISVSGLLKEEKFIPDPRIDEDGAISTGAYGNQLVLENVKYTLQE